MHSPRIALATLIVGLLSFSGVASSKIPPMSEARMTAMADLIATGKVVKVVNVGDIVRDHCFGWQHKHATFQLDKVTKGKLSGKVTLSYKTRVESKKKCKGGQTSFDLPTGAPFKLWLLATKEDARRFVFVNWNGVRRTDTK